MDYRQSATKMASTFGEEINLTRGLQRIIHRELSSSTRKSMEETSKGQRFVLGIMKVKTIALGNQ